MPFGAIIPILTATGIGAAVGAATGGVSNALNRGFNSITPLQLPDPITLTTLVRRGEIQQTEYVELMKQLGYDEQQTTNIRTAQEQILNINENINLFRRGLLATDTETDEQVFFSNMEQLGVEQNVAQKLLTANEVIPSAQDLIQFLVREVFTPSVRAKFSYDSDFPEAALTEGAKIGIPAQLMRDYWAAHWVLPSVSQMYESLHRFNPKYIDRAADDLSAIGLAADQVSTDVDTVEEFLKVADYPEYFRNRLLATSYSNLTRVDVRRMVRLQLLDYNDAEYQYLKQGYYPRDARRLTKFGYVYESIGRWKDEVKAGTATLTSILEEARQWNINNSDSDPQIAAENQKLIAAIRREVQPSIDESLDPERSLAKSEVLRSFELGITNETETLALIEGLGYDRDQAIFILDVRKAQINARNEPESNTRQLTKTDILTSFREGVFSQEQAIEQLIGYGLSREDAAVVIETYKRKYNID